MKDIVVFSIEATTPSDEYSRRVITHLEALKYDERWAPIGELDLHIEDLPFAFNEVAEQIVGFFGQCNLAAHNLLTEALPILQRELREHDYELDVSEVLLMDTSALYRFFRSTDERAIYEAYIPDRDVPTRTVRIVADTLREQLGSEVLPVQHHKISQIMRNRGR